MVAAASRREQERPDGGDEARELLCFGAKLAAAGVGDRVELRFASELGGAPVGLDPAVALHAVERRVERAFFDVQSVARLFAEPADDGVAVARPEGERLEDEGVEGAVQSVFGSGMPCSLVV